MSREWLFKNIYYSLTPCIRDRQATGSTPVRRTIFAYLIVLVLQGLFFMVNNKLNRHSSCFRLFQVKLVNKDKKA